MERCLQKKKKNCARHWILNQHEKLDSSSFQLKFFLLEHTSGDDNDPRLKGRNCGFFFEELKRERERERERGRERERERERDREKKKGREGMLERKRQSRKVRAREGHEETESKAPGK